jgi:SMI1/KNR4 family protein SUKH-1
VIDPADILRKLSALRSRASGHAVFGADSHQYQLNAVAPASAIEGFEKKHRARLPDDYRDFLIHCGNGGAGPYYGLFPLGLFDGSGNGLEPWIEGGGFAGVLSRSFPHRAAWNLPDDRFTMPDDLAGEDAEQAWYEELDKECWRPELVDGAFPICHQGCAYRNLLVVSGPERGHIWLDGRASDGGIVPVADGGGSRVSFAVWYTSWLDAALAGRDFE